MPTAWTIEFIITDNDSISQNLVLAERLESRSKLPQKLKRAARFIDHISYLEQMLNQKTKFYIHLYAIFCGIFHLVNSASKMRPHVSTSNSNI